MADDVTLFPGACEENTMVAIINTEERLINALTPYLAPDEGTPICIHGFVAQPWIQLCFTGIALSALTQTACVLGLTDQRLLIVRYSLVFSKPEGHPAEIIPLSAITRVSVKRVPLLWQLAFKPDIRLSFYVSGDKHYSIDIDSKGRNLPTLPFRVKHGENRDIITSRLLALADKQQTV